MRVLEDTREELQPHSSFCSVRSLGLGITSGATKAQNAQGRRSEGGAWIRLFAPFPNEGIRGTRGPRCTICRHMCVIRFGGQGVGVPSPAVPMLWLGGCNCGRSVQASVDCGCVRRRGVKALSYLLCCCRSVDVQFCVFLTFFGHFISEFGSLQLTVFAPCFMWGNMPAHEPARSEVMNGFPVDPAIGDLRGTRVQ